MYTNDINSLFYGSNLAENIVNLQDTGGQAVIFYQYKDMLVGIQIGNTRCGNTSQTETTSFTLPPDGTFILYELQSRSNNQVCYISIDGQNPCGSNNYPDAKLMVNLKVKFASIGYDAGAIRSLRFTIVN